jgi:hypothetical protein
VNTKADWQLIKTSTGISDFDKARKFISNNKKRYGANVNNNLLSVISIHELSNILKIYWDDCFKQSFNNTEYEKWKDKLDTLYKARNPLAHGNAEYLSSSDITLSNAYCEEILFETKNFRLKQAI